MIGAKLELVVVGIVFAGLGLGLWFACRPAQKKASSSILRAGPAPEDGVSSDQTSVEHIGMNEKHNESGDRGVPRGLHNITPYITVNDTAAALEFYRQAFSAKELPGRLTAPDGNVMHAMFQIGNSVIMIADEMLADGKMYSPSPSTQGATTFKLNLYVEDAKAVVAQAVDAGAELIIPVAEQFYGHLSGRVVDPFGHIWIISTELEKLTDEEMQRRFSALFG